MLIYAAIDIASLLALAIGVIGLAGVLFTALRFRRDDTSAVINQQAAITAEMKTLSDEQRSTLAGVREERDRLRSEVDRLTGQIELLQAQLSGKVSPVRRQADDG